MKQQKRRTRGWLRWTAVVILLLIALVLIFNQQIKYYLTESYRPQITRQAIQKNQAKQSSANYDYNDAQDLSLQTVAKARAKKQPINIIGEITVPAIDLTIPIANGVDNTTLALAAGTMRPNMKMGEGNYALAGHNMANGSKVLFSPLYSKSKVGQKIYITDLKNVYEYKIYERKIIDPSEVEVVNNTKNKIITLITCDETGAHRLMVRGSYVKKMPFNKAPQQVQHNFSSKYTTGRNS
ncbi:class A sortase [Limosilactobacillus fastidiosus]|uniref:Class A sortase n=1 Tax=Limosilactobacillus fastidiosus TaxID=2759855 RepID=A0A7W3U0B9_9LACO|nr:class A sortase [Limosilactobacillus fastidiosus]MBB1086586.1 class A sortase [Limosilactobacillus fastidiosus]MCD7086562.1 class A sortase [Limosilactobacillus fastidiosus]MCD7115270.1 class A sortase [Limosilactobacillus fastidiosus]MCD7116927.1 class A sortase [Limosilactobacillus fastidiosus]